MQPAPEDTKAIMKGGDTLAMTNTEKLEQKIKDSGYRIEYVAEKCGLSAQGLLKKRNNETEFKASEILVLKTLLNLSDEETNEIFFCP